MVCNFGNEELWLQAPSGTVRLSTTGDNYVATELLHIAPRSAALLEGVE